MATLKLTYNSINQITPYFKFLEDIPNLTFGQRRSLSRLNEQLQKELNALTAEIKKIAEDYSEKDENGNQIVLENGAIKLQMDKMDEINKKLEEIYLTEIELEYNNFKLNEKYFENLQCDKTTFELVEKNFIE